MSNLKIAQMLTEIVQPLYDQRWILTNDMKILEHLPKEKQEKMKQIMNSNEKLARLVRECAECITK